jgi:xanthine dehydrogenase YagR molybdenum-binding subunit
MIVAFRSAKGRSFAERKTTIHCGIVRQEIEGTMPNNWPKKPNRLIGTSVQRLDGPDKATGRARYSYDINRPGMLHAKILRCPHAHAKLTSLDTSAAEKMPGFKAVHVITEAGKELFYAGDEVAAVACDTEEHAEDAVRALGLKAVYEILPFQVDEEDALKNDLKTTSAAGGKRDNVRPGAEAVTGDPDAAFKATDAVVHEGSYGVSTICHQCLETHGLVAEWDQDGNLTVWASTQAVEGTARGLATNFSIPATKVKCITHYMGGGFGSKFGPDVQGIAAAELARKAKAPVKLMLDRAEELTAAGTRPSAFGKVKIAATKDGKITAFQVDCYGSPGSGNGATVTMQLLPYVYTDSIPNIRKKHSVIRLNTGSSRAMRAPNHPQNSVLTDCPVDDLAAKIGMDPLKMRLVNLPQNTPDAIKNAPLSFNALRNTIYNDEIKIASKLIDWDKNWHAPGKGPSKGPWKYGIGMALHTWGGAAAGGNPPPNECTVIVSADGSVTVQSSSQDLGTAYRTMMAIVVAEILGVEPRDVVMKVGESQYGRSTGSGGSTTTPSQAPAALNAAIAARKDLFTRIAKKLDADPDKLEITTGKVVDTANKKEWPWKEACAKLGMEDARGTGNWSAIMADKDPGISNVGVGGVQMAEVWVDTETGVVRCTKVVAVQDCGLIINKLACESQVAGGVVMGVNYALFEERIMDRATGRMVNPDMEFYKLGGIEDMPKIVVHMHDMPERGVIGIGEPPTISTAAAIGNAIFNAIGVRVAYAPYTPERVLEALAKKG